MNCGVTTTRFADTEVYWALNGIRPMQGKFSSVLGAYKNSSKY
jgi:hypothetical protein